VNDFGKKFYEYRIQNSVPNTLINLFFLLETKKKNREKNSDFTNEEKLIFSRSFSFKNVCKFIEYRILFGIIINKLMLNH